MASMAELASCRWSSRASHAIGIHPRINEQDVWMSFLRACVRDACVVRHTRGMTPIMEPWKMVPFFVRAAS